MGNVFLILNVLSKICDGQKVVVQDYLREQNGTTRTENIVAEVALFMKKYGRYGFNSKSSFQLTVLLLRTLLEMCIGNIENKKVVIRQGILEIINFVLLFSSDSTAEDHTDSGGVLNFFKNIDINELKHFQQHFLQSLSPLSAHSKNFTKDIRAELLMKSNALELLQTLIEETSKESDEFIRRVGRGLDRRTLALLLKYFYDLKDMETNARTNPFALQAEKALFAVYHIIFQLHNCQDLQKLYSKEAIFHVSGMEKLLIVTNMYNVKLSNNTLICVVVFNSV